jgi:hypothetical protein
MNMIRAAKFLVVCCLLELCANTAHGLSINEIRIDQGGGDNSEYFELTGAPGESLDGLTLIVMGDVSSSAGVVPGDQSGRIESVTDLSGQTIPDDGFFLAAEDTFGTGGLGLTGSVDLSLSGDANDLNFENSDNLTFLLVSGFSGLLDEDIDTNDDGSLDATPWTGIVDEVALLENHPPSAANDEWVYSATQLAAGLTRPEWQTFRNRVR